MSSYDFRKDMSNASRILRKKISRRTALAGMAGVGGALLAPTTVMAQGLNSLNSAGNGSAGGSNNSASSLINVTGARLSPVPIALPDFSGTGNQEAALGQQITGVISNDLASCGMFNVMNPGIFPPNIQGLNSVPDFSAWQPTNTQALVIGQVAVSGTTLHVAFRLWNIITGRELEGTSYTSDLNNWRRISHIIADDIYQKILGIEGYFDTQIAFVSHTGRLTNPILRLCVMDQDGASPHFLTNGDWAALSPRFDPAKYALAFMSYYDNRPQIYLLNLSTGQRQSVGNFPGMSFAPRFSPDGQKIIFSVTDGGGSNLWIYNMQTGQIMQLTFLGSSGVIDTAPCYSPDGSQVVFVSDRGGSQQLYTMNADGSNIQRISFGGGDYGGPVWSPTGDLIAFTQVGEQGFTIGVMGPDGEGERLLSQGFMVSEPAFCPNGQVIVFTRQTPMIDAEGDGYSSTLVTVNVTGFNERTLITPTNASGASWSPLLS